MHFVTKNENSVKESVLSIKILFRYAELNLMNSNVRRKSISRNISRSSRKKCIDSPTIPLRLSQIPKSKKNYLRGKLKKETREGEKRSFQKGKKCASSEK